MTTLRTLYHGTSRDFDAFDEAMIGSNPNTHANSNLGIWFAVADDWVSGFGGRVIAADVDLGTVYDLPVSQLARMSNARFPLAEDDAADDAEDEAAPFRAFRQQLLDAGYDSIAIVEHGDRVDMYVVLRAASIKAIRDLVPLAPAPGPR